MSTNGNSSERILVSGYIIVAIFFILAVRLWQLQILEGDEYRKISEENRLRIVRVAAPRGIIYDRNGIPLVRNAPYYYVSINSRNVKNLDLPALSKLLSMDIDSLVEKISGRSQQNLYEPIRLKEGLSLKEVARIEARRSDFPGLGIDVDVSRDYLFGSTGAHLIGYLGKPNRFQYNNPDFRDVPSDAFIGQWGVEKLYDRELRGTAGERVIEVDALGRELRLLSEKPPVRGEDIKLAMDINLQKRAEEAFGEKTGALVAIKPDTGEILALVSRPSFDPNLFARGIKYKEWKELAEDRKLPMLNRALQSQYPPGSTFKIITAIAALEEGVADTNTKVTCDGSISYGRWRFGCWLKKGHGSLSLHRALVESCDVYFYEMGKRLGIDRLAAYARMFGLGKESGLHLVKERRGLIPDTNWKLQKRNQPWYLGETFNAAIGQGYVAATPFQMAEITSIVANGGYVYKPSLLALENKPQPLEKLNLKQETLEAVKKGLFGVVNENGGTGWSARSSVTSICGKTGTAQVIGARRDHGHIPEKYRDHAWFVAFAPYEAPKIALSVLVEHGGHGGEAAGPIVRKTIEAYMRTKKNEDRQTVN
jgi:penicillin-binding protein 2